MAGYHLDSDAILKTVAILGDRIRERFPDAGLNRVCTDLHDVAKHARKRSISIGRPMIGVRLGSAVLILLIVSVFAFAVKLVRIPDQPLQAAEFIQVLDAGFGALVLIAATIAFLVTLESRVKRGRALRAMHELRSIVHVIDMHQLTKDPERILSTGVRTKSSPELKLTRFELNRYLDYCSEMLALCGKIGALYVDNFPDSDAVAAVNDLENLTSGLARKIWQKIMVLNAMPGPAPEASQSKQAT